MGSSADTIKRTCDNREFQIADAKLESVKKTIKKSKTPWEDLSSVFKIWESCKDRFQDEGFIDVIAELVSTRWDKISDLIELKTKNPNFYKYIISSLGDDTVGYDRRKRIVSLSQKQCPEKAKEICKDIEFADRAN